MSTPVSTGNSLLDIVNRFRGRTTPITAEELYGSNGPRVGMDPSGTMTLPAGTTQGQIDTTRKAATGAAGDVASILTGALPAGVEANRGMLENAGGAYSHRQGVDTREGITRLDAEVGARQKVMGTTADLGLRVADRIAQHNQPLIGAISNAVSGDQALETQRMQLLDRVLNKPKSFGQTLGEITSAIAPIAALFIG
jgi:hypothetical protein